MAVIVEYLLIIQKVDTFCDSVEAFNRLLQVDSSITIKQGHIEFNTEFTCDYQITTGEIVGKEQRFFHSRYSIKTENENDIEKFSELLKSVRSSIGRLGNQPETLWDDVSFYYSKQAYPEIHRIENLMRKLIANFMLVSIGKEWISEASPMEFTQAMDKSKRKEYLNVLHNVDFIHLSEFLLRPYANGNIQELYTKLKKATTITDLEELKKFGPESNWTRYFSSLVDCDDGYLQKRWTDLYELRCKVAHNAIINRSEFDRIKTLVGEIEPKLQDAINKLPQLKVPEAEVEQIAENAASNISELVGEFISAWKILEAAAFDKSEEFGVRTHNALSAFRLLRERDIFDDAQLTEAHRVSRVKNHLIHPTGVEVSESEIRQTIRDILKLIDATGYFK